MRKAIHFVLFSFLTYSRLSLAWDGPPQGVGSGLASMAEPVSFVGLSGFGGSSPSPYQYELRGNAVIVKESERTLQLNAKFGQLQNPSFVSLNPGQPGVPGALYDLEIGANYKKKIDDKDSWGLIAGFGSFSDILFNSTNELDVNATFLYTHKVDPLHHWMFFLNDSTTRSFWANIPIPGAGYLTIDPANKLTIFYGVPFFINWGFAPRWEFNFSYFLLTAVKTDVNYSITKNTKVFTQFEWMPQVWMRANRSDAQNRLIFDRKALTVGTSTNLWDPWYFKVQGGYEFDQRWTEAYSITSNNANFTYLPNGAFAAFEIGAHF